MSKKTQDPVARQIGSGMPSLTFEDEVRARVGELRSACSGLIAAASGTRGGGGIHTATELREALSIRSTLAWQLFRVATAKDPLQVVGSIPGAEGIKRVVQAGRVKGLPPERLEALLSSASAFERLARDRAGSRKTFNSMVAGLCEDGDPDLDLQYRREAFHANSHIWAMQARTKVQAVILHPSSGTHSDLLGLSGTVELTRLRGETPYMVSKTMCTEGPGWRPTLGHPLAAKSVAEPGCTILTEFCSKPLPEMRNFVDEEGWLVAEMLTADVGRPHAATVFLAELFRSGVSRIRTEEDITFGATGFVRVPFSTFVFDLVVASGMHGAWLPTPEAMVLKNFEGERAFYRDIHMHGRFEKHIIDRPRVVYLGAGANVLETPDVPRYPEVFEHVCREVGWDPSVFHVFRCRIEYPVLPSSVVVGYELPE